MDFDEKEKTDAIPFNNPIVEAAKRDNDRSGNDPYNMNSMNNPNMRTQKDYMDPRSSMMEKAQKQGFSVKGLLKGLALNALPGMGMMNMIKGVTGLLPANKRALMENDLLGKGYSLDSLGRIVTDDYNSKTGIMAGYNANQIDANSFKNRIDTIKETIGRKQAKGLDTSVLENRLGLLDQAKTDFLGSTKTAEELEEEINDFKKNQSFLQKIGIAPSYTSNFLSAGVKQGEVVREKERVQEALKEAARKAAEKTEEQNRRDAIDRDNRGGDNHGGAGSGTGGVGATGPGSGGGYNEGNFCFDPSTLIQMANGSTKKIKDIQLGDNTKGGEVTGVFQFKATDEIHDYKGVTVAGSHYVKEDGRFIMVKDSPLSVKIDKIPVVYSLDTSNRRIFINDIEFADYNGDGIAKGFLANAGFSVAGFDKEVLRQVEDRLI
jgi:hypothetical protein